MQASVEYRPGLQYRACQTAWHAHSQDEEFLYLVMEYLPGGDVMVTPWLRCPGRSMCKAGSACTVEQ